MLFRSINQKYRAFFYTWAKQPKYFTKITRIFRRKYFAWQFVQLLTHLRLPFQSIGSRWNFYLMGKLPSHFQHQTSQTINPRDIGGWLVERSPTSITFPWFFLRLWPYKMFSDNESRIKKKVTVSIAGENKVASKFAFNYMMKKLFIYLVRCDLFFLSLLFIRLKNYR